MGLRFSLALALGILAASPAAATTERCTAPFGMNAITASKARTIVFGEVHGTNEAPAFVGDVACTLAARGEPVLVAVELSAADNPALQDAWAAPHQSFANRLRGALGDWRETNSGQASQAVFDMLVKLHAQKAMGAPIRIVAFNGARPHQVRKFAAEVGQNRHEAEQAANIQLAQLIPPFGRTIVLTGNFHASRQPVPVGGVAVRPMAARLGRNLINFDLVTSGGQSWDCEASTSVRNKAEVTTADLDCGPHSFRAAGDLHGSPRVIVKADLPAAFPLTPGFDGVYYVGPVSAAAPVR